MPAGSEGTPPQLEDAQGALLALGHPRRREVDDRVGDGKFGRVGDLLHVVLADPEGGGRKDREVPCEVMEEAAKLRARRLGRERLEAVDDAQTGTALLDEGTHPLEDTVQSALV